MDIKPLEIEGAFLLAPQKISDDRGFFARTFCINELKKAGLHSTYPQSNISFNNLKGTFRGMHLQRAPKEEVKIVRCTRGRIFDMILDLRPESRTFKKWMGVDLSFENHQALYIPTGCAHGFQTLEDNSEVLYLMGEFYEASLASGVRYDDRAFNIKLPLAISIMSDRDRAYPDFI